MDRARWRTTLAYRALPMLQIGVEYNLSAGEATPLATWFLTRERERRPAAFLGTSSDRIGSPEGTQCYFLTASKHAHRVPVSAYASVNYSEWDKGFNFPFGFDLFLGRGFSVRPMYDGERTHLTGSYSWSTFSATLLYVWLERPGVSVSVGF